MQISESKERYLEAIYALTKLQNVVIAVDIANYMNYSRATVSCALKQLQNLDYIQIGIHNIISLTDKGNRIASQLDERRLFFLNLLLRSGLEQKLAEADADRLTHAISEDGYDKLRTIVVG